MKSVEQCQSNTESPDIWLPKTEVAIQQAEAVLPRTHLGVLILGIDSLLEAGVYNISGLDDVGKTKIVFTEKLIENATTVANKLHGKLYAVSHEIGGNMDKIPEITPEMTRQTFAKAAQTLHEKWAELEIAEQHDYALVIFNELADLFHSKTFLALCKKFRQSFTLKNEADGSHPSREAVEQEILKMIEVQLTHIDGEEELEKFKAKVLETLTFTY